MNDKSYTRQTGQTALLSDFYGGIQETTKTFQIFIFFVLIGLIAGIFIVLSTNDLIAASVLVMGILPLIICLYLVRQGKFEGAGFLLASFLILVTTILATRGLGIHHISSFAYPVILIIASLVISRWMMIYLTSFTILCIGWLVFGELWGLYTPSVLIRSVLGDFFSVSLIVILAAVMVFRITGTLSRSFARLQNEISERKNAEDQLRQREMILEAITFAAEQFLKSSDWRININAVLERLGKTIDATHAYLFEHHIHTDGIEYTSLSHEWTAPGFPSDLDNPFYQTPHPVREDADGSDGSLRKGDLFIGNSSTFPPSERERLNELGVKAMVEVPLFVNDEWWGTIGFDDMVVERTWSLAEVDALKIAAGILGAAIQRQEAESAVRESERIYRQAIEAVGAVPYYLDYRVHRYTFMGDGIKEIAGYSSSEMTPQLWEQMELQRYPRGSMAHLTYEEADRLTDDGTLRKWECDYLILNRYGQERWIADASIQVLDDKNAKVGVVGILQDITDRKLTEAGLRKRESMLEAVAFSAEQFLRTPNWRDGIDEVIERLGREFSASHAYLFESHHQPDGSVLRSMRYEWVAPGQKSDFDNPAYQNATEHEEEFKHYYDVLNRGEPFVGSTSYLSDGERSYFNSVGIKALLEIRIMVDGRQWGTLGFDDMVNEREWTAMEMDVIMVAASVLGASIKRQLDEETLKNELAERKRAELALRFSEEKFSKAFHTTQVMMTIENNDHIFIDANKAFLEGMGFKQNDIIGHSATDLNIFHAPEDRALLRETLQKNDGTLKDYEMPFRRKNGEKGIILLSSETIKLDDAEYILTSGLDITERKHVEVALRESEARYRALFEQSHDAVFILNLNAQHITANERAAEMLGYTVDEIQKLSMRDLSVEIPESEKVMQRLVAGEHVPTFERLFRKKNGEVFPVEISVELVRDDKGEPLHIQSVVRDVSDRKLAELRIQKQAARAEALASLSQLLTRVTHDQSLIFDTVVRRCAELIGDGSSVFLYSPENEYLDLVAVYNPNPRAVDIFRDEISKYPLRWSEGAYAKVIGENQPVLIPFIDVEKLIENAPPERKEYYRKLPIHSMMLMPLHVGGKVLGVIGMARHSPGRDYTPEDLTFLQDIADRSALAMLNAQYYSDLERELAERKRAEEKYRSIFDNSIEGIFQSTVDGRFINVNPAMARMYGYDSPDDMVENVYDIAAQLYVNAEQRREVRRRLSSGEKVVGYETLDNRRDGSTFWASMSIQVIRDENGKILHYEGKVEDISLRKEAEAEREALIQELEKKNIELEQFTYTVSHDLKSPLVTINGFLGFLEQDAVSGNMERLKKDAQRIGEAVHKMQRLLNELLELSRIGRMMKAPETIPFDDLVKEALEIVHGRLRERSVTVHTHPNLPTVHGDRPRLVEVIQNLIDNAAKYMGDQSNPHIEIGQRGKENGLPVFFIRDNGMGIEKEHHERVFGLFNKLDARSEGTGVGLALVKRITEFHGGRIWVESESGKGSTFLFTLPTGPEANQPDSAL